MFKLKEKKIVLPLPNVSLEEDYVNKIIEQLTDLSKENRENIEQLIEKIKTYYAVIMSLMSGSLDASLPDIIVACEDVEKLAVIIRNTVTEPLLAKSLYSIIVDPIVALKSSLQDQVGVDPYVLQTSQFRSKKLLATQSIICRDRIYSEALKEHLLNIRQLFNQNSSREESPYGPSCFISYAWPIYKYQENEQHLQAFLKIFHEHLRLAGIQVVLDIIDNPAGNSTHAFMQQAKNSDCVILILTQSLKDKHNDMRSRALHSELQLIREKHDADIAIFGEAVSRIYPVVVSGELGLSSPPYLQMYSNVKDWREHHYLEDLKNFLCWIYISASCRKANDNTTGISYEKLWQEFCKKNPMPDLNDENIETELSFGYHAELIKVIKNRQTYGELAAERGEGFFSVDIQHDSMFAMSSAADAHFLSDMRRRLDPVNEQSDKINELELYISPSGRDPISSSETPTKLLLEFVRDFFKNPSATILLLQGRAGSGKTIFGLNLAHKLNTEKKDELRLPSDAVIIFISLPGLNNPHDIFREYFSQKYGENSENEIKKLKLRNNVYFIFDAYDEIDLFQKDISQVKNLYTTNKMCEWSKAKFVFTCRADFLYKMTEKFSETSYRKFFAPVINAKTRLDLLTEVQVSEFIPEQINDYIDEYVRLGRHRVPPHQTNIWGAQTYKQKIQELPNIKDIVKSPLYLKMTVEALPIISAWHEARMRDSGERFLKITERDVFLAYLKVNILRQEAKILQTVSSSVSIENFRSKCINFLVRLCRKMVENQVYKVPYRFLRTERDVNRMNQGKEWATEFFGDPFFKQDREQLEILESLRHNLTCFLTYEKGLWGFIHDAFRDHFDDLNLSELLHLKTQFEQEMSEEAAAGEAVDKFSSILFDETLGPYYLTKQNEWADIRVKYELSEIAVVTTSIFSSSESNAADRFIKASGDDNVRCDFAYQELVLRAVKDGLHLLKGENGNTALHLAIKNFQLDKTKTILQAIKSLGERAVEILNITNDVGETILTCDEDMLSMPEVCDLFNEIKNIEFRRGSSSVPG